MSENGNAAFDELDAELHAHGIDATFEKLADRLRAEEKYHDLFDVRLMQARYRHGLPVIATQTLDELPEPLRSRMEEAYLAACRETGYLLLQSGQVREAWLYLRPLGERNEVAAALRRVPANDKNYDQIIEVALHEGVCPRLGFELVLAHYGTCNAISLFEAQMHGRSREDKQAVAGLLVQHLHGELLANVRADITRRQGRAPQEETLAALVAERDWLFADGNYHVDTSHLAAVVRFALLIDERRELELALDLTEYGRRLDPQYQYPGIEPFVDTYPAHGLFFSALLGQDAERSLAYFRERAESLAGSDAGPGAAEVYVALLARMGRYCEAMDASARLIPPGTRTAHFAPSLPELARLAGRFDRLQQIARSRGDLLGYVAGLVEDKLHHP
jgi:hypothetical protein